MAKYNKNFLKTVVFRIDFPKIELGNLNEFFDEELKAVFPSYEEKEGKSEMFAINFAEGKLEKNSNAFPIWIFRSADSKKKLEVGTDHLFVEYTTYIDSADLFIDVQMISAKFLALFDIKTINRVGLRYINEISKPTGDPFEWGDLISSELIGHLTFAPDYKSNMRRAMSQMIFNQEASFLQFNYGVWNKDYPALPTLSEFVLDFDCFSKLPFNPAEEDLVTLIRAYYASIEGLFEASITDAMRELLTQV